MGDTTLFTTLRDLYNKNRDSEPFDIGTGDSMVTTVEKILQDISTRPKSTPLHVESAIRDCNRLSYSIRIAIAELKQKQMEHQPSHTSHLIVSSPQQSCGKEEPILEAGVRIVAPPGSTQRLMQLLQAQLDIIKNEKASLLSALTLLQVTASAHDDSSFSKSAPRNNRILICSFFRKWYTNN